MSDESQTSEPKEATRVSEATVVIRPDADGHLPVPKLNLSGPSDDYAICGKVGDGGMGVVYLARDRRLGRYVAIKRLNEKALADNVLRQRFLQEARAVAALNHAYIVHIYALGEDALGPYIVMEYVAGPTETEVISSGQSTSIHSQPHNLTLEHFIHKQGPMTAEEACNMLLKIARTIVYAHSCGVIHRDLKPANILLDPSYEPKLVDFGLARIDARENETVQAELTQPGEKLVSLGYSAPELEQDASASDSRADIYSLGAILYFLLTGRNPRYYREQDVPVFLREVLSRSLAPDREQRFRTAQDLVRALSDAASHGKGVAPTIKTTWRCKWCDAVNPISTKFCAECGWDGSEKCLECGAEIFIGQQYCTSCGADCRMYEHVNSIVKLMESAWNERHFERINTIVGRLHGFEPAGPTGRKILTEAHSRVEEAERKVARRNRLASLIPSELKAENYERAKSFIDEFRELAEDPLVYEEELRELPEKILHRDLLRVRKCVQMRDWKTARHLINALLPKYSLVPEFQSARAMLLRHEKRRSQRVFVWLGILVVAVYALSAPWVARLSGKELSNAWQNFYVPINALASTAPLQPLADRYMLVATAKRWQTVFTRNDLVVAPPPPVEHLPEALYLARQTFDTQLKELESSRKQLEYQAIVQYQQALKTLLKERQEGAGDYEGTLACQKALDAYVKTRSLGTIEPGDPESLANLKRRFLQMSDEQLMIYALQLSANAKKYTSTLESELKATTQRGEMEVASTINKELTRVKSLKSLVLANDLIAKVAATTGTDALPSVSRGSTAAPTFAELEALNAARESNRVKIEAIDKAAAEANEQWGADYTAALQALMKNLTTVNDLNGWEAANYELERFKLDNKLESADIMDEPEDLRALQQRYYLAKTQRQKERNIAVLSLYNDYIHKLEAWKSDLTRRGAMDAASSINAELRRFLQSPDYLTATGHPPKATELPPVPLTQQNTTTAPVVVVNAPANVSVTPADSKTPITVAPIAPVAPKAPAPVVVVAQPTTPATPPTVTHEAGASIKKSMEALLDALRNTPDKNQTPASNK